MSKFIRPVAVTDWRKDSQPWGSARSNLYLLQEEDGPWLKIGVAGHPTRRLMMLQSGNPRRLHLRLVYEGVESACVAAERYVLRYFKCQGSEWFRGEFDDVQRLLEAFCEATS